MKKVSSIVSIFVSAFLVFPFSVQAAEGDMIRYSLGAGPGIGGYNYPIAIAFDGTNLWVATAQDSDKNLKKISLNGLILSSYPVPNSGVASYPMDIAFDGNNIWIANWTWGGGTSGAVVKASPTGVMTPYVFADHQPYSIAFDGTNMWTAAWASVGKISPAGVITRYPLASHPWDIAFDGTDMWTANYGGGITKISSTGAMTSYPTGKAQGTIAFDGTNMWATSGDGTVSKISPAGNVTVYTVPGNPALSDIAFDGTNMWVGYLGFDDGMGSYWPDDRVIRISPTGDMQIYIGTGNQAASIASDGAYGANLWTVAGGSSMWTADYLGNSITKIGTASVLANCGPADGVPIATAPTPTPAIPPNNLCTSGSAPTVTDAGASFDWTCDGPDNLDATADDVSCSAPKPPTLSLCTTSGIPIAIASMIPYSRTLLVGSSESFNAFYDTTPNICGDTAPVTDASWSDDPSSTVVSIAGVNVSPQTVTAGSSGIERVTVNRGTDAILLDYTVTQICSSGCTTDRRAAVCLGETYQTTDSCGSAETCDGTRYCDFNWKEVAPGN